jgi:hypothetical protein
MQLTDLVNEYNFRKCRGPEDATPAELAEAFAFFCENYAFIKHPNQGRIPFVLRDAQKETVEAWLGERYTIVLKARQIGFSTLAAAYAFWITFFWPDRFVVMLSKTEREATKLLQKAKYIYKFIPDWMRLSGPELLQNNVLKMSFNNDSVIESMPSANEPARGESVYLAIIDEMAFLPNPEEAWASIEPIADVGGRVICLSTAKGEGNIFFQLWQGSQNNTNRFKGIFFPWSASGRDQAWYDAQAAELPPWQLHQEYPSNPEEAFIRSGRPVFDIDALNRFETSIPKKGHNKKLSDMRNSYMFDQDGGPLSVWQLPQAGARYVIGADVAEGLARGDYSTAHVIDAKSGVVVAHWHGHVDPDRFGEEVLYALGFFYNEALVGVESNNHGLTTLTALNKSNYHNLYRQRRLNQRHAEATETLGWRTTTLTKPLAVDELNANIRDGVLDIRCEYTIAELKTFVRDDNGSTHGSPHDDRVMSLAIANQMLKYVWLPEYSPKSDAPWGTLNFFAANVKKPAPKKERYTIGEFNWYNDSM